MMFDQCGPSKNTNQILSLRTLIDGPRLLHTQAFLALQVPAMPAESAGG